jgi:GNAT superfamily N-acetyltransferase
VEIREAVPDDRLQVWPLVEAFATSYVPDRHAFSRSFDALVARDDTAVLVAVDAAAGRIVGYVLASCHGTLFANGPVAWVEEVMVDEASRRAGVGRQLISAAEAWGSDVGVAYVALATRRADDFYLHLGYEKSATYYKKELD